MALRQHLFLNPRPTLKSESMHITEEERDAFYTERKIWRPSSGKPAPITGELKKAMPGNRPKTAPAKKQESNTTATTKQGNSYQDKKTKFSMYSTTKKSSSSRPYSARPSRNAEPPRPGSAFSTFSNAEKVEEWEVELYSDQDEKCDKGDEEFDNLFAGFKGQGTSKSRPKSAKPRHEAAPTSILVSNRPSSAQQNVKILESNSAAAQQQKTTSSKSSKSTNPSAAPSAKSSNVEMNRETTAAASSTVLDSVNNTASSSSSSGDQEPRKSGIISILKTFTRSHDEKINRMSQPSSPASQSSTDETNHLSSPIVKSNPDLSSVSRKPDSGLETAASADLTSAASKKSSNDFVRTSNNDLTNRFVRNLAVPSDVKKTKSQSSLLSKDKSRSQDIKKSTSSVVDRKLNQLEGVYANKAEIPPSRHESNDSLSKKKSKSAKSLDISVA